MKYTVFVSALMGIAAAKKDRKDKCSEELVQRCSADRNVVESCIKGSWQSVEFCKAAPRGRPYDNGVCTEEPTVACRKPDSPVAVDWEPEPPRPAVVTVSGASSETAAPSGVITVKLTPGVAPTNIPSNLPVFLPPPAVPIPTWVEEPAW